MTSPLPYTVKAGRLVRLMGWITLAILLLVGAAILIPSFQKDYPLPRELIVPGAVAIFVTAMYLVIGAGLKRFRPWARVAAVALSVLSLFNFPLGTIMGAFTLFYLFKGWREVPADA